MKFMIELDDEFAKSVIKEQLERKIGFVVGSHAITQEISERVKKQIANGIDAIIREEFAKSDKIREIVREELKKRITSQLRKLEKEAKNEPA